MQRRRFLALWAAAADAAPLPATPANRFVSGRPGGPPPPPPPPPPPAAGLSPFSPALVRTTGSLDDQVTLVWLPPTRYADLSAISGNTSSVVYRSQTAGQAKSGGTGVTSHVVAAGTYSLNMTGLATGVWYFAIESVKDDVVSYLSREISRTVI